MARRNSKQTFFRSPLFITAAAFVILFVIFWTIYSKNYNANFTQTPITETVDEISNWTDPDLGDVNNWQTYNSQFEGLSFKYPPTWKVRKKIDKTYEELTLLTPSGFEFQYISGLRYRDGGCIDCIVRYAERVNIPNFKEMTIVENDRGGGAGVIYLSEDNVKVRDDNLNWFIDSKVSPGQRDFVFQGEFWERDGSMNKVMKPEEFSARQEVQSARKILRTITY